MSKQVAEYALLFQNAFIVQAARAALQIAPLPCRRKEALPRGSASSVRILVAILASEHYLSYSIRVIRPPISSIGSPGFMTCERMWQWKG